jgi:hypothetical protein
MSDPESKKIVDARNLRAIALDHNTVAGAESALRHKTAFLTVAGASARLSNATAQLNQVAQQPQASSTTEVSATVPPRKQK